MLVIEILKDVDDDCSGSAELFLMISGADVSECSVDGDDAHFEALQLFAQILPIFERICGAPLLLHKVKLMKVKDYV